MPVVLLVDDQPFIGVAVKGHLAGAPDLELTVCHDPHQAQELAARIRPAVVLIDLVMPGLDGLTLIERLRADPATSHLPLIALSGNDDERSRQKAFAAGASDFVLKLPAARELIAVIRRHAAVENPQEPPAAAGTATTAPAPPASPPQTEQTLDRDAIAALRDLNPETGSAFLTSLVTLFIGEADRQLDELHDAVARGDGEAMRNLGHRLRGSSHTIGARRLAALSAQMEDHGVRNRGAAVGRVLLTEIVKEFAAVRSALTEEMERGTGAASRAKGAPQ